MAIKTLQITQTGAAIQLSSVSQRARWIAFFNTSGHTCRIGDANVSSTVGAQLPATTGNWTVMPPESAPYGTDLSQWYTVGTASDLLDVVYDSMD